MSKRAPVLPVCCGAALICSLLTSSGCRGEKTFVAEIRNGVRYVHNIKPASERLVAGLAFVGKIGELESTDPDRQFVSPMSADEDAAGNLFILDDRESCVKKFDAKRNFLVRFGRKGQGPGEFEFAMSVGVTASGRVIVATGTSEFHVFDNDGIYVDRFRLPPYRGISPAVLGSDRVVVYAFQLEGTNGPDNPVLAIFDFQGQVRHEFGKPFLLDTARKTWNANFLSLAVDGDENIYAAFSSLNRIEKYSPDGRLVLSIDRVLPYEIAHRYETSPMEIRGRVVEVDQPAFTPVNRGIGVDSRGRIWVLSFQKAVSGLQPPKDIKIRDLVAFEIYSPAGVLLSRVPFPPEVVKFDNLTMRGDHLFIVDPFDEACVYEYAVVDRDE